MAEDKGRRRRRSAPEQRYELRPQLLAGDGIQREIADRWRVDRSTVVKVREVNRAVQSYKRLCESRAKLRSGAYLYTESGAVVPYSPTRQTSARGDGGMKAVVLGGGIVGVTTAYYLASEGYQVAVIDRQDSLGAETTAVNAGAIAPGHSFAWASPKAPKILVKSLFSEHTAFKMHLKTLLDPRMISWGLRFLRECTTERARRNTLVKLRLCQYSQEKLDELVQKEDVPHDESHNGMLYLYRDHAMLEQGQLQMQLLIDHGQEMQFLDAEGCARVEPALAPVKDKLAGAIYGVTDAAGDSKLFSQRLGVIVEKMGGTLHLNTTIHSLAATGNTIQGVVTDKGDISGDLYVLSLGSYSPLISRTVGVKLPIYPVKGHSITAPVISEEMAPKAGGVDEHRLVGWTRMAERLRMSSTADFAGYDTNNDPHHYSTIFETAKTLFPEAADYAKAKLHSGLRPMTPDGPPIIGKGKHDNLWYNTGHGHMGWTMACGASRIAADLICGREPEIATAGMGLRS